MSLSVAESTRQTYSSGEKRFLDFCSLYRLCPPLPAKEDTLIRYVSYLARSIKHSSIKGYLAAVRHLHIRNCFDLNLKKLLRLQMVCKGIKRAQGSGTRVRLPITIEHLNLFFCLLAIPRTKNNDSVMIWAAMTLAFFGFLRLGELTCNTKFSNETHLSPNDIMFLPDIASAKYMSIRIKASKTDPFREGHTIYVGATNSQICPVKAMINYLSARGTAPGPLFKYLSGKLLTKDGLTAETRQLLSFGGIDPSKYAGHSYRIGAATTAASAGLPQWLIKTLGRWSSDCYERYIKCSHSLLFEVSGKLLKVSRH